MFCVRSEQVHGPWRQHSECCSGSAFRNAACLVSSTKFTPSPLEETQTACSRCHAVCKGSCSQPWRWPLCRLPAWTANSWTSFLLWSGFGVSTLSCGRRLGKLAERRGAYVRLVAEHGDGPEVPRLGSSHRLPFRKGHFRTVIFVQPASKHIRPA